MQSKTFDTPLKVVFLLQLFLAKNSLLHSTLLEVSILKISQIHTVRNSSQLLQKYSTDELWKENLDHE